MLIHLANEVRFNWISRRGTNDRVDATIRAKRGCVEAVNFVDPFSDFGWWKHLETIKEDTVGTAH